VRAPSSYLHRLMLVTLLALTCTTVHASTPGEHYFAVFQDDFEDWDGEGWELNVGPNASYGAYWKVVEDDGNNVLSVKGTVMVALGETYWTDYTLIVKVKLVDGTETVSINIRMENGQGYSACFSPENFEFIKSTGFDTEPIYLTKIPSSMSGGTWYTVKIVCVDSKFFVYLDDELMFQCEDEDDPVLSGRISFGCGPDNVVYYDDVWVGVTHTDYAGYMITLAQQLIDEAKTLGADVDEPERMIAEARAKLEEGELDAAVNIADAAAQKAKGNMELLAAESQEQQPESQEQSTTQPGTALSIERVATIITIGGAIAGFGGWILKTRGDRRKRAILFRELMQATDDAYQRNRGNPRLCEAELLRLKDRAINEYKKNLITEKDYNALDERVREYVRELREAAGGRV